MDEIIKKHFFFVRHAETEWNCRKLCQGQKDIPLNERGIEEAEAFAGEIVKLNVDCLVSSPLSRALQTAKAIHHVHPGASFYTTAELSERSWGSWKGFQAKKCMQLRDWRRKIRHILQVRGLS